MHHPLRRFLRRLDRRVDRTTERALRVHTAGALEDLRLRNARVLDEVYDALGEVRAELAGTRAELAELRARLGRPDG